KMQGFWILLLAVLIMYTYATKNLNHGQELSFQLPTWVVTLEFEANWKQNKSKKDVLWNTSSTAKRGIVTGDDDKRRFIIYSVTFDDNGTYIRRNSEKKEKLSVNISQILNTQHCVAGQNVTISLAGLKKDNATLIHKKNNTYITLVEHGSPVSNYMGRIQVADDSITVLNVGVSDKGFYIIRDSKNRIVKKTLLILDGKKGNPLYALLLLLGIPFCGCCCKKLCKDDTSQSTTTTDVKYDAETSQLTSPAEPAPGYTPVYPAGGASSVYPPPNPALPPQPPYGGYPATDNLTCYPPPTL
ncbi:DNA-directed RNA polymerase II subunit RPB1-like isoform X2, partial [Clarias magur]